MRSNLINAALSRLYCGKDVLFIHKLAILKKSFWAHNTNESMGIGVSAASVPGWETCSRDADCFQDTTGSELLHCTFGIKPANNK